ncbi:MAG: hypothetical protein K5894_09850 [Lachnospiraceae bacterium]|nr:hypothetical protein [Lachnospiraceae bacterium]
MKNKKAVALLLTASMIFTMNANAFAGTKSYTVTLDPGTSTFTGDEIEQSITVQSPNKTLEFGTDYWIQSANSDTEATDAGTYNIRIEYSDKETQDVTWSINAANIADTTATVSAMTYTGSEINLADKLSLKLNNNYTLTNDDYTLSGVTSKTNAGNYTATATGKDNFKGTKEINWTIAPASLANAEIALEGADDSYTGEYTGKAQKVSINSVTLNDGDTELVAGTDYEIDESASTFEATDAGTYTIAITGLGNYEGSTASEEWTIDEASIESAKISLSLKGVSYDGAEHTTEITAVSWNDIELEEGTDYTVSSSSVLKATVSGSYFVYINGIGNFEDSARASWSIIGVEEGENGTHVIDAGDVEEVTIPSETWTSISDEASTVVKMGEAEITLPSNVVSDFAADDVASVEIVAKSETKTADTVSDDYAGIGFVPTTENVQIFTFEINLTKDDGTTEKYDFDGKYIDVAADITEDEIKELGKGKAFAYCVATDADVTLPEYVGKNSNDAAVMDMRLYHQSEYAFTAEIDAAGKVSVVFNATAVDEAGNYLGVEDLEFIDTTDDEITLTTNSSSGFKVTAPYIVAPGYQAVKWICSDDSNEDATAAPGSTLQLDSSLYLNDEDYEVNYKVVLKALNTVSSTTISANGHKIVVNVLTTPAYAGRKMKGVDLVDSVSVDGKYIDKSLVKVKTKGKKNVGSSVTVTLKSIKGLDKDTNKALKNTALPSATIRAISATETSLWSKKYSKEGQMIVKMKNGTPKKVWAVVPKGYKLDSTKNSIRTAKKAKMKNGFTYDSSTGYLTFDGTYATGTIKVNITSK